MAQAFPKKSFGCSLFPGTTTLSLILVCPAGGEHDVPNQNGQVDGYAGLDDHTPRQRKSEITGESFGSKGGWDLNQGDLVDLVGIEPTTSSMPSRSRNTTTYSVQRIVAPALHSNNKGTNRQFLLARKIPALVRRCGASLLHCRSPLSLVPSSTSITGSLLTERPL